MWGVPSTPSTDPSADGMLGARPAQHREALQHPLDDALDLSSLRRSGRAGAGWTVRNQMERLEREVAKLRRRLADTVEVEYVEESGDGDGLVGAPCRSVTH
jgi:hypothetical protein